MPWGRDRMGNVVEGKLVHFLFEWFKDGRCHWDTQCGLTWAHRDNVDRTLMPAVSKKAITCVACVAYHMKTGAPW